MTMSNKQASNVTMSEGGLYSLATKGAKDVIDIATPRVIEALQSIPEIGDRFTIADMGCADAGTSLDMLRNVLKHVKKRNPATQSTVIYADQPANDFNALISIIHGRTAFESWLGEIENAYPLVSGSSFYSQAVPDNSLDMAFSATAMHWLSAKPCNISGHVHMVGASGEEYKAFEQQGKSDWANILKHRAKELKSGGKMVLVNFCRDEQGHYLGHTGGVNMFDTFNSIWQQFQSDGRISSEEYKSMTLPQYYNTVEEFSAPLTDTQSTVYKDGLRLESIKTATVPCPFAVEFEQHKDSKKFADGLIPTVRSWNQSIFKAELSNERSEAEKVQLIEDYYSTYHQMVVDDPKGHGMDYVHAYTTIAKV